MANDDKMPDRFDLEQAIMNCWNTADDLDLLAEQVLDESVDFDDIANALLGLKALHHMRMQRAWATFECLVENGDIE